MQSGAPTASAVKKGLWAGRVITALTALFLLFDSSLKMMRLAPAVQATTQLGYPEKLVLAIGIAEFFCVLLYMIPRTSILGAILLVGYLGGATATQVRLGNPWFLFPVVLGVLVWGGLFLRDVRLRALLPLRAIPVGKVTE
jgi:DoxX-like family